jgi:GMP reductase
MSSKTAMNKYYGGIADYRSAEGKETLIPYRGELRNTLEDILGGLRSCCTYVGATHLKHLTKRATFIRTNSTHNTHWRNDE